MLSLFSTKSEGGVIGIDIGTRSIKAIELQNKKNKPYLVNYGWVDLISDDAPLSDTSQGDYQQRMRSALDQLIASLNTTATRANVSIPGFNGLVLMIDFPKMEESEIEQAIQFEARKYIPASLDEINISWEVVPEETMTDNVNGEVEEGDTKGDVMKVLLVAAPKSEVQHYDELFQGMSLTVDTLELETFSLVRSLIGNDPGTFVIVDIGAKTTNLILARNGIVQINRNVDVGGRDITNTIADALNINAERATTYKEGGRDFLTNVGSSVAFPSLDFIVAEVDRIIAAFGTSEDINSIILSGGSAKMTGINHYFEKTLKVKTIVGNPWSHIACDDSIRPYVEEKIGSSFAVAIGLALKDMSS